MDMGKVILGSVGVVCITALGIVYFIFVRQDGTVLATLSGAIGAIIGLILGKKVVEKK